MSGEVTLTKNERDMLVRTVRIAGAVKQDRAEWIVSHPHLALDVESIVAARVTAERERIAAEIEAMGVYSDGGRYDDPYQRGYGAGRDAAASIARGVSA